MRRALRGLDCWAERGRGVRKIARTVAMRVRRMAGLSGRRCVSDCVRWSGGYGRYRRGARALGRDGLYEHPTFNIPRPTCGAPSVDFGAAEEEGVAEYGDVGEGHGG